MESFYISVFKDMFSFIYKILFGADAELIEKWGNAEVLVNAT